jgi:hypothetical protein
VMELIAADVLPALRADGARNVVVDGAGTV